MKKAWTIMVYISADDVLASYAIESLNQLRQAGDGIAVMAQFGANAKEAPHRLRFDELRASDAPLDTIWKRNASKSPMTDPATLTAFVNWASAECEARHYCLILWGHGTELLLDQDLKDRTRMRPRYLTPAKLHKALIDTKLAKEDKKKLDIIGLDACNMSMVELASELQDCVDFMIASQDEVPDASFPYGRILAQLKRGNRDNVKGICKKIPDLYKKAYQDYFVTPETGVSGITLSSLNLGEIKVITEPLRRLAEALLSSISDRYLSEAIVSARRISRDFVLGLFVDLYDFCDKLAKELVAAKKTGGELKRVCREICDAIGKPTCVIDNQTGGNEKGCHGLSIYFPYSVQENEDGQTRRLFGAAETGIVNLPSVKGGTNDARKARIARIEELEKDFKKLDCFRETGWVTFIEHGWSVLLSQKFPDKLDLHYSAEQCALNLLSLYDKSKREETSTNSPE